MSLGFLLLLLLAASWVGYLWTGARRERRRLRERLRERSSGMRRIAAGLYRPTRQEDC